MAIARDSGAAYPLVNGASGTVSSVTVSGVTTNNASTLIVVRVGLANSVPTTQHPVTVAWSGGAPAGASTFTKQVEASGDAITQSHNGSIWTATCDQTVSGQAIVVTAAASSANCAFSVAVDALTGTSRSFGASPPSNWWNGSATAATRALTISTGSWVFVCAGTESATSLAVQGTTVQDDQRADVPNAVVGTCGIDTSGTAGSLTVGWGTTTTWGGVAALEVLADAGIGLTDTVATSDAVSLYGPVAFAPTTAFQANAFQHVGAFQILAGTGAAPGPDWSVTDTVTTSDSAQLARVGAVSATDTVTTSDQVALARQSTATVSDSVTVSDDAQIARRAALSASDTVTTSDDAQITRVGAVTASDTVTTSDQALISRVGGLEVSDTVTTFDDVAIATETGATFATTDTVVTSDAIALARALSLGCSDTVTVTDDVAMQRAAGGQLTVTDVVSVTDAVAIARAAVLQISDTVTVTDSVVASGAPTPPVVATRKTGDWIPWWMRHKSRSLRRWK